MPLGSPGRGHRSCGPGPFEARRACASASVSSRATRRWALRRRRASGARQARKRLINSDMALLSRSAGRNASATQTLKDLTARIHPRPVDRDRSTSDTTPSHARRASAGPLLLVSMKEDGSSMGLVLAVRDLAWVGGGERRSSLYCLLGGRTMRHWRPAPGGSSPLGPSGGQTKSGASLEWTRFGGHLRACGVRPRKDGVCSAENPSRLSAGVPSRGGRAVARRPLSARVGRELGRL